MRFIHISDVHLGMEPDYGMSWSGARKEEIEHCLLRIIEYANTHKIDFIFISGDLFDGRPDMDRLESVDELFMKLHHTCVLYIAGSSDYMDQSSALNSYEFKAEVHVLGSPVDKRGTFSCVRQDYADINTDCLYFPEYDLDVYGVSCFKKTANVDPLEDIKVWNRNRTNVLLAYGGSGKNRPLDFVALKKSDFDYIALGMRHRYDVICRDKIIYPGSPEPLDESATGRHGFVLGYIENGGTETEFVSFSDREYKTIEYPVHRFSTNDEVKDDLKRMLSKEGSDNIYTIRLVRLDGCEENYELSEALRDFNILRIEGEAFVRTDYDRYMKANTYNDFGRLLEAMNSANPLESDGVKLAVDMVIEESGINYYHNARMSDRQYDDSNNMVRARLMARKDNLENSHVMKDYKAAEEDYRVNPDVLDKLNNAWTEERKAVLAYKTAAHAVEQIEKDHRRKWIRVGVRTALIPFIIVCVVCIIYMPVAYMRMTKGAVSGAAGVIPFVGFMISALCFAIGYGISRYRDVRRKKQTGKSPLNQEIENARVLLDMWNNKVDELRKLRNEYQEMDRKRRNASDVYSESRQRAETCAGEIKRIDIAIKTLNEYKQIQ